MTFEEFIYDLGLGRPHIISDGEIHRFKPPGSKTNSGWYISYPNLNYEAGVVGDWRANLQEKFCNINKVEFTLEQKRAYAKQVAKATAQRKKDEVTKLKDDERAYHLLEHVGTKPNVVYQVKVRNTKEA